MGKFKWESAVDVPPPINKYDPDTPLAGFLVKIICRSPNSGERAFIRDKFMLPIREKGRTSSKQFYIDRVALIEVSKATTPLASANKPGSSRGARGGTTSAASAAGIASSVPASSMDPITLEPTTNDWRFEIWASAFLGEMPAEGEAAPAEASKDKKPDDKKPKPPKDKP